MSYTFDRFVCHSGNDAAYGFSTLASLSANRAQNPLLITGPTGSGKSHLLNAIGLQYLRLANDTNILRIDASIFSALDPNTLDEKLVSLDMLLIDNLETVICDPIAQDLIQVVGQRISIRGGQVALVLRADTKEMPKFQERLLQYLAQGIRVHCGRMAS